MEIRKTTLYMVGIIVIILSGITIIMSQETTGKITGKVTNTTNAQQITIGMKGFNYDPQVIRVKAGQPVSIKLDSSVAGCFRDFTIRELGIRKYLKDSSDTIIFTPEQKGTYTFACSMGMGTGTLVVE